MLEHSANRSRAQRFGLHGTIEAMSSSDAHFLAGVAALGFIACTNSNPEEARPTPVATNVEVAAKDYDSLEVAAKKSQCLRSQAEITVIDSDEDLAAATWDSTGECPTMSRPIVDFSKDAIVLGHLITQCPGSILVADDGFTFTETGGCAHVEESQYWIAKVIPRERAVDQKFRRVVWSKLPEYREEAMRLVAGYMRRDLNALQESYIGEDGLDILYNGTGDSATKVHRAADQLTKHDLDRSMIVSKGIDAFDCPEDPKDGAFDCFASGKGYVNRYTLKVREEHFMSFVITSIEESNHQ